MEFFQVVADPHRRDILAQLVPGQRSVGDLVVALGTSQPAVSKHLKVLREAGFVSVTVDRQRRLYRIEPGRFVELDAWLAPYRALWNAKLDDLEEHLESGG